METTPPKSIPQMETTCVYIYMYMYVCMYVLYKYLLYIFYQKNKT